MFFKVGIHLEIDSAQTGRLRVLFCCMPKNTLRGAMTSASLVVEKYPRREGKPRRGKPPRFCLFLEEFSTLCTFLSSLDLKVLVRTFFTDVADDPLKHIVCLGNVTHFNIFSPRKQDLNSHFLIHLVDNSLLKFYSWLAKKGDNLIWSEYILGDLTCKSPRIWQQDKTSEQKTHLAFLLI